MDKHEKKVKQDRAHYEKLCKVAGIYGMSSSVDWYWHYNELKKKLKK